MTAACSPQPVTRSVARRDLTGTIVSEIPAAMGLGSRAEVRIEPRDMGEGQTLLQIVNSNLHHVWAEWNTTEPAVAIAATVREK